jgi:hypothetical protein
LVFQSLRPLGLGRHRFSPAVDTTNARHFSKTGFDTMARMKNSKIRRSVLIDQMKKVDSWFKGMRDPCQVEG